MLGVAGWEMGILRLYRGGLGKGKCVGTPSGGKNCWGKKNDLQREADQRTGAYRNQAQRGEKKQRARAKNGMQQRPSIERGTSTCQEGGHHEFDAIGLKWKVTKSMGRSKP